MEQSIGEIKSVSYSWQFNGGQNHLKLAVCGPAQPLVGDSQPEFITEHYWGYAKQRDGSTMEYRVEHPRWKIWKTQKAELCCDVADLYGAVFCEFLERPPSSALLADGSEVKVYQGVKL